MSLADLESRKSERKVARTQGRKDIELPESPLRPRNLECSRFEKSFSESWRSTPRD